MKRVVTVLLLLLAFNGFAQTKPFTKEKDQFFEELNAYLTSSKEDKAEAVAMMNEFRGVWNMHYDTEEAAMAMDLYELMRAKTANRAYYNIFTFTEILLRAPYSGMTKADMNRFLSYFSRRFTKRQAQLDKFLKSCRDLFVDHLLGDKGAVQWVAPNANFTFPTDTACIFEVKQCDLILQSSKDQSIIHNTLGRVNLETHLWTGKGGRVDWSRLGIPSDKVYAELNDYQINLTASNYRIEHAEFHNKYYFSRSCECVFEDAVTNATPNEKTMYPQATPTGGQMEHGKLFGDVDFLGRFGMVGQTVNFFGTEREPAQIVFRHHGKVTVRVRSKRFALTENSLLANQTSTSIYLYDTVFNTIDSIYHNDLGFRYNDNNKEVLLYRKDNGVGTGPFHDTYHEYDIFLEAISWDRNKEEMDFQRLVGTSGISEGKISSISYFRRSDYLKIQALDNRHPMETLNQFLKTYGDDKNRFHVNDLADYLKFPSSQVISLILNLQSEGYVEYEKDTQICTALDRFFDVLASEHGDFDFDVIKFQTKVANHQPNIRLFLRTNDMMVYGISDFQSESDVPAITLSDFKHVLILPDNARIVLKKHRNFNFSGCIMAGMYEFFTKDCLFNYSKFSIEMNKVDSLRFYARFSGKVYPVEGTLERLSGTLTIDESDNKSSVRETPDYPKFNSSGYSYKFYRDINSGVFDLELPLDSLKDEDLAGKFYFRLDPFSADRLDNLNSEDVSFKGRLVSGGIFPDIIEPLVVMEDHSLGFRHVIGDGTSSSYPMFDGKGGFHQEVHLSNEGFYGKGQLDVETSEFLSQRFDFYLDSVVADVESFNMKERSTGTHFPKASCGPLDMKWDLTVPQLCTYTKDEPICLYGNTFFRGNTVLNEKGFSGDGVLTSGLTRFDSKYFDFDARSFVADTSDFVLFDEDGETKAFLADNYRAHVDLNAQKVQFEYLNEESDLDFPLNKFYCSLREAEWDMVSNRVHLSSSSESQAASKFVSLLPEHDSLWFNSTNADYDMNEYVIHAHEVTNLRVADVEILPMRGDLQIMRNAAISPLEHATILTDTVPQQHVFKDAAVSIYSRNDYSALGIKDYVDAAGVATPLFFEEIAPVEGVTVAHAKVDDEAGFKLSPYFSFKGDITSKASEPFDLYEGSFRLEQSCLEDTVWFASKATIDPQTVEIPIVMDDVKKARQGIFNGLCYEFGNQCSYHVNFLKPMNPETTTVTNQNGSLTYDVENQSYVIQDTLQAGQELRLTNRCLVTMHTVSNLGFDEGLTQFACYGDFVNYPNDSLTMKVLNVFNVPLFDDQVMKEIAEVYASVDGEAVDLTKTPYVEYLRVTEGGEAAELLSREMELEGYPAIEESGFYDKTIVIPSLKMIWNPTLRAYVSEGKIGLGSIGQHIVNRYVDGYVMFDRRLGVITYYFEEDMFQTYISYNCPDGQLQVHATYGSVNKRLMDTKERKRRTSTDEASFEYVATPYEAMTDFLSRLKRAEVR
ncbi:MAG: hypothetical protein J6W30_04185 [Bacteroidales bacterium]|nr:hypothetical protein [Bacteroidales bacterium]